MSGCNVQCASPPIIFFQELFQLLGKCLFCTFSPETFFGISQERGYDDGAFGRITWLPRLLVQFTPNPHLSNIIFRPCSQKQAFMFARIVIEPIYNSIEMISNFKQLNQFLFNVLNHCRWEGVRQIQLKECQPNTQLR